MAKKCVPDNIPDGFTLLHTLRGHGGWISRIAGSPDGCWIASPSEDNGEAQDREDLEGIEEDCISGWPYLEKIIADIADVVQERGQ